jgi:peptide methionine sulfoxide reductase MsrA
LLKVYQTTGGCEGLSRQDRHAGAQLKEFYEAEAYHQNYLVNHPNEPYIVYNDMPKLGKPS